MITVGIAFIKKELYLLSKGSHLSHVLCHHTQQLSPFGGVFLKVSPMVLEPIMNYTALGCSALGCSKYTLFQFLNVCTGDT